MLFRSLREPQGASRSGNGLAGVGGSRVRNANQSLVAGASLSHDGRWRRSKAVDADVSPCINDGGRVLGQPYLNDEWRMRNRRLEFTDRSYIRSVEATFYLEESSRSLTVGSKSRTIWGQMCGKEHPQMVVGPGSKSESNPTRTGHRQCV